MPIGKREINNSKKNLQLFSYKLNNQDKFWWKSLSIEQQSNAYRQYQPDLQQAESDYMALNRMKKLSSILEIDTTFPIKDWFDGEINTLKSIYQPDMNKHRDLVITEILK
jgi:hypothetical protein